MRPVFAVILGSRVSAVGVALATASALLFLFLVAPDLLAFLRNQYAGPVVFIMLPALFVLGLLLIPVGGNSIWSRRAVIAGRFPHLSRRCRRFPRPVSGADQASLQQAIGTDRSIESRSRHACRKYLLQERWRSAIAEPGDGGQAANFLFAVQD